MGAEDLLRNARLERGLTLDDVIVRTRLRRSWAEKIDEGRFSELPPGVYARGYLRAFASAVGVDGAAVLAQLSGTLPEPADPIPMLRELAKERTPPTLLAYLMERLDELRKKDQDRPVGRHAAPVVDALLLLLLNGVVAWIVAQTCGVTLGTLLNAAGGALAPIALLTCAAYFLLLAGIGGQTPGAWLCGRPPSAGVTPLDIKTILRRAWHSG